MASRIDQWHEAAAKVSPMLWEVQKAHEWSRESAKKRLQELSNLKRLKDYIGILGSEPEMESLRDRLIVTPVNYPVSTYREPFLLEREREIVVYDLDGKQVFRGEPTPEQATDYLRWCSRFFIRLVGIKPPRKGP